MNISENIVGATEVAAVAASRWIGSGQKLEADKAATDAMREELDSRIEICAKIVMGEGKKDESYGLFSGETVGKQAKMWESDGSAYKRYYGTIEPKWLDVAVDPVEGTTQTVISGPEAMSVIAIANPGCFFQTDYYYMNRIAYGKKIKNKVKLSLNNPLKENLRLAAQATNKSISELMVCVLDRPRHQKVIEQLRELGVRIKLIRDCDVAGALASCLPSSDVDFLYGIGGAPEAVISAAAIRCLDGYTEAQIYDTSLSGKPDHLFSNDNESWVPIGDIIPMERLASSTCIFSATGITDGTIFRGVKQTDLGIRTHSLFMRSDTSTIRWIDTYHNPQRFSNS